MELPASLLPRADEPRGVPVRWLLTALLAWLAGDMLLLLPFVGRADWIAWGASPLVAASLVACGWWSLRDLRATVSLRTVAVCAVVALVLLLLGGEGRVFYANTDWRVRDGVLHDMAVHPWPFAYTARGLPEMLRAPLGMYLMPALAMKAGGQSVGDWALVVQNTMLLAIVLALGAPLFSGVRGRVVALAVFVGFSGMDIVGSWLSARHYGAAIPDHIEWWAEPLQFSSHITQIFWVPQHALAGWIGAVAFALWRTQGLRAGVVMMLVPLTVFWSPLGALGALPFAAIAGVIDLLAKRLRPLDVALPALASLLAVPVLLYLSADLAAVGARTTGAGLAGYVAFEALEAVPLLMIAAWAAHRQRLGRLTLAVIAAMLLLLPLGQVGFAGDFVMRASIAPLALLALMVADSVQAEQVRGRQVMAVVILTLGAATGWHEVRRALTLPPSPPPLCSFYGAWGPSPAANKSTYLAAVSRLPAAIRPARVTLVSDPDPPRCWARDWPMPTGI